MKIRVKIAACLLAAALPASAISQELVLGVGHTDYAAAAGEDTEILSLAYRYNPFFEGDVFSASLGANASITGESDFFIGAGVWLRWGWDSGWFVDFSLMPGYYDEGTPGNDLGYDLEFRSLLGLGYQFDGGQSVSLAYTHKSNASLGNTNPGADTVLLRWHAPL